MTLTCEPLRSLFPRWKKKEKDAAPTSTRRIFRSKEPAKPFQWTGPFPFLRLPRELRNSIYEEALTRREHSEIWIRYSMNRKKWWDATYYCKCNGQKGYNRGIEKLTLGLLFTSKQVHDEALEALYRSNIIWIDAPPQKMLEFLSGLHPIARQNIHSLKFYMDWYVLHASSERYFYQLSEEEKAQEIQERLLEPWQKLLPYIADNLPCLRSLCVLRKPIMPREVFFVEPVTAGWAHFYFQEWLGKVSAIRTLQELRLDLEVDCGGSSENGYEGIQHMRRMLLKFSCFREVSVEWEHTFFQAGGFDTSVWPTSLLILRLQRKQEEENDDVVSLKSDSEEIRLTPLPEFVQKYTLEDATYMHICTMGEPGPPRSPDNNR